MHRVAPAVNAVLESDPGHSAQTKPAHRRGSRKPTKPRPAAPPVLPALSTSKHFLNLTNGLEAIPLLESLHLSYGFVRIQSTFCEQQRFDALLANLDASFLLHLALGHCCFVWDFASRDKKRGLPRAVWYGLEFITYVLRRVWFQRCTEAWLRRHNVTSVFEQHLNGLEDSTIAKLRYYMRYIPPGVTDVQLYGVCQSTIHDPDPGYYREIALRHMQPSSQQGPADPAPQMSVLADAAKPVILSGESPVEDVLQSHGYRVFLGGMYHTDEYRAM